MTIKKFAWFLFFYTLLVIVWGAWVRISHSGNGCGESWPLCNGQVLPNAKQIKTLIEFSHRLTSGLFGILIIAQHFWIRKLFPANSLQRKLSALCLGFMISEALLGAKLVLFGLVGQNDSFYRLFIMSLHQLNSFLLTAFVFLNAYLLDKKTLHHSLLKHFRLCGLFLFIVMSGAIAALASTLFPSQSLWEGLVNDFATDAHFLLRLRIFHPFLAIVLSSIFIWFFFKEKESKSMLLQKKYSQTIWAFLGIVVFGSLTLLSLSPIWMKIGHLLLAHGVWAALLRLSAQSVITDSDASEFAGFKKPL